MKIASRHSLCPDPALRAAAEAVLHEGESLSEFVEQSVRVQVGIRRQQGTFIARGLRARDRAQVSGRYVDAIDVLERLASRLADARRI